MKLSLVAAAVTLSQLAGKGRKASRGGAEDAEGLHSAAKRQARSSIGPGVFERNTSASSAPLREPINPSESRIAAGHI